MTDKLEITMGWFSGREPVYRTIAELYIAPEFLLGIIQGKYEVDAAQFPADVQLRHAEWDDTSKSFKLVLESKDYPKTAEGNIPCAISLRLRHKADA